MLGALDIKGLEVTGSELLILDHSLESLQWLKITFYSWAASVHNCDIILHALVWNQSVMVFMHDPQDRSTARCQ